MTVDIAVVGSMNRDLTVHVPAHPRPGETVLGHDHFTGAGGKGANQAAAAAKLGRTVAMVGRVGDDGAGAFLVATLADQGVDTTHVRVDQTAVTGIAVITLDESAENTIVVSPGANLRLSADDVASAAEVVRTAQVLLVQLEVPIDVVVAAVELAEGIVVLNPAPARPLPEGLLERVDVLVPNRSELAALAGAVEADSVAQARAQAAALAGPAAIVVTLGASGALVTGEDGLEHVAAPAIVPVDTTGAGDAFCGALADGLATAHSLTDAVRWAVHAGAAAATRRGAQTSLPTANEVAGLMAE